jgi:molybdopterin molybdotransferase
MNRTLAASSPVMISEAEARSRILESIQPLLSRRVGLGQALDCFAAENYVARIPLPAFDNSAMDGYAVVASSCASAKQLRLIGEQPAGVDRSLRVAAGEAVRIFTGAPIPSGADAVVMQEDVTRDGDNIVIDTEVAPGDFIRGRGCDLTEGQKILERGERIRPTTSALLASQGFAELEVGGEVEAAIISTGDEIVGPGTKTKPGQIYDSNTVLLDGLLRRLGVTTRSVEHCPDEEKALTAAIKRGKSSRVLIISGGVSVGEHDLVRPVVQSLGGQIDIWRVAVKPGKPFLFGSIGDCALFGLPGNPVSAFVTFLKFVRPAILKMMGAGDDELDLPRIAARLTIDLRNDGDRAHYFRGQLKSGGFAPVGRQESHALFGLSRSNALLHLAPGENVPAGASVHVEVWD